ncbi:MAG: DUF1674 domain-containing protein [Gammaproteobacteria bacterium]|nr:DUF1674 domain-containing protein [Gammaproteobacteria bacterium]
MQDTHTTPPLQPGSQDSAQRLQQKTQKQVQEQEQDKELPEEIGGRDGPDPVRYGDWEKGGRCIDF